MERAVIVLATLALAFPLAWAQAAKAKSPPPASSDVGSNEEEAGAEEAGEAVPIEAVPAAKKKGTFVKGLMQAPGETHTVIKGDTLWDLSTRYLQTPWYWPKVWSYNPDIANPHWIYPGQTVRFFASGEEAPARVEVAEPEEPANLATPEMGEVTVGTMDAPDLMGQDDDTVTRAGKIAQVPLRSGIMRRDGFVTPVELAESGSIDKSFAENDMLSQFDRVYLRFKSGAPRVGDRFIVFRTAGEVTHPKTGELYGYLTHIQGSLQVARLDEGYVTGVIDRSFDEIRRGDFVAPFTAKFERPLLGKANTKELKGYVIASFVPRLGELGEYQIVFVDRGKRDGIEDGQTFNVVRRSDGLQHIMSRREDPSLPQEDLGVLMVIDTKDTAAACVVLRSLREITLGDRVEMRMPRARTAQVP